MDFYTPPLIALTDKGLYCHAGDFYIDPHRAVETAVVTHAHSDHARRGSARYFCEKSGVGLLKSRLGKNISATGIPYGETFQLGKVKVSFHSAGHILGSAQVRVEYEGSVWVASGDYKRDPDPSCEPFEVVHCHTFITEATFGTSKYVWDKKATHGEDLVRWWNESSEKGANCILFGYSLGKAQRILAELEAFAERPILIHPTIRELAECYRKEGRRLAPTRCLIEAIEELSQPRLFKDPSRPSGIEDGNAVEIKRLKGEFILSPPSIRDETWIDRLGDYETAFASGWMQGNTSVFGRGKRYDRGFVISDHADWDDLNRTILETGAKRVFVQHRNGLLVRHLRKKGIDAHPEDSLRLENYRKMGGESLGLFG